nr:hypothetical protein [Tanacetum cinerariifolium]
MLLYSRDRGLDVCVDLTRSSPLTQTGMTDFATGRVVSDAAHRKRSDVLNYAFIASRLQSDSLKTKLLRHVGIVASGSTFEEALCMFNNATGIDFLSNPGEDLIMEDGPRRGLFLNVDKTELFWPSEDPRSRLEGVFPHKFSRPLHGVKLLGGPVSVDADLSSAIVMKRISKTIGLLDAVAKINDP